MATNNSSVTIRKKAGAAGLSVMCCLDGSRMSNLAFGVAARLRGKGSMHVLHVSDPDKPGLPGHLNPDYLRDLFELNCAKYAIPSRNWAVEVIERAPAEDGPDGAKEPVRNVIHAVAVEQRPDVVVLGAFGRKGAQPSIWGNGSNTDWSARTLETTTAIVKSGVRGFSEFLNERSRWVCCFDGSQRSVQGVEFALASLRPDLGDELLLLHVLEEADPRSGWRQAGNANQLDAKTAMLHDVAEKVQAAAANGAASEEAAARARGAVSLALVDRNPNAPIGQQIAQFAAQSEATFLVVGVDGMSAWENSNGNFDKFLGESFGSISDYVVRHARCVIVVAK